MRTRALVALLALAAPPAPRPTPTPALSGAEELYRAGRDALARGAFDAAARTFRALEDDPALAATAGYAFNRAQAARFLANAGEAVFWYGRYLALAPSAPDAATVRELSAKLAASYPKAVRAEAVRRVRAEWQQALADRELESALRHCPEARLAVRFAKNGSVLGGTAYLFSARVVFWELPEGDAPGAMWVVPVEPVAPPEDLNGPPLLVLPPGRAIALPVGPEFASPPVTFVPPSAPGFPPDAGLAAWRVEVSARLDREGPPLLLVARNTVEALAEIRSGAADGPFAVGKKRRDAPSEPMRLAFGPRAARPDAKNAPKGLLAAVVLPLREGLLESWALPLGGADVVNRFLRRTDEAEGTRLWVRADATGPSLRALAK